MKLKITTDKGVRTLNASSREDEDALLKREFSLGHKSTTAKDLFEAGEAVCFGEQWVFGETLRTSLGDMPAADLEITTGTDDGPNPVHWFEARTSDGTLVKRSCNPVLKRGLTKRMSDGDGEVKPVTAIMTSRGLMLTSDLVERVYPDALEYWLVLPDMTPKQYKTAKAENPVMFDQRDLNGYPQYLELVHRSAIPTRG